MSAMVLNMIAIVMMTLVGGIVLWLHRKIDVMRESAEQLPMLTNKLTEALTLAQREMLVLKNNVQRTEPIVNSQLKKAQTAEQDLTFLIQRAEKMLDQLEQQTKAAKTQVNTVKPAASVAQEATQKTLAQQAELNLPRNVEGAVIRKEVVQAAPVAARPEEQKKPVQTGVQAAEPVMVPTSASGATGRRRVVSRGEAALRQLAAQR